MGNFKLDVLQAIADKSTPYCDIQDLESEYDIRSENFTASFLQLKGEGLIASNSSTCGLRISADGFVSWSVVDLYITDLGKLTLNPPKESVTKKTFKVIEHPIISGLVVAGIIGAVSYLGSFLGNDQESSQQHIQSPSKTNESQSNN